MHNLCYRCIPCAIGARPLSPMSQLLRERCSRTLLLLSTSARLAAPATPTCTMIDVIVDQKRIKLTLSLSERLSFLMLHIVLVLHNMSAMYCSPTGLSSQSLILSWHTTLQLIRITFILCIHWYNLASHSK